MTYQTGVPAGWYPDPAAAGSTRWWDGQAWTHHTAPAPPAAAPPQPAYAAPPQPAYGAQPGYGPPSGYAGYPVHGGHAAPQTDGVGAHPNDAVHWIVPTGRSGLAIAAGYLGIAALFCFYVAPFSLVVGILALRQLNGQNEKHGKGRAIFGIVAGVIGLLVGLLVLLSSRS